MYQTHCLKLVRKDLPALEADFSTRQEKAQLLYSNTNIRAEMAIDVNEKMLILLIYNLKNIESSIDESFKSIKKVLDEKVLDKNVSNYTDLENHSNCVQKPNMMFSLKRMITQLLKMDELIKEIDARKEALSSGDQSAGSTIPDAQ